MLVALFVSVDCAMICICHVNLITIFGKILIFFGIFLFCYIWQEKELQSTTMDDFNSERSKPWNMYTDSPHSSPQTGGDGEVPWKNFGSSMNAISFGFVATAVLISMFLIMAIFEHLFKPNDSFPLPQHGTDHSPQESRQMHKLVDQQPQVSPHSEL